MSNNGTMMKVRDLQTCRLNPVEVLVAWNLLFGALKSSGMFPHDEGIALLLHDAMMEKVEIWILKVKEEEEDSSRLVGVLCTKIFRSPYTGELGFTMPHAHVAKGEDGGFFVDDAAWLVIFKTLLRYAKMRGCDYAEIYSDNVRAQKLLKSFGFEQADAYRRNL